MQILFLFLDGVGLGADDPAINPLVRANMPRLRALLGGQPLIASAAPFDGERATLLALDASLGVEGLPQSATGQAVLLTGINIPKEIGHHYGPKPNPEVAAYLKNGNTLFSWLRADGKSAALLNAYPPRYFHSIESGHRLYSSVPLALTSAGFPLFTKDDLYTSRALAADFTGEWGHIPGARSLPLEELPAQLANLEDRKQRPIRLVCRTDRRSAQAARLLAEAGFTDARVIHSDANGLDSRVQRREDLHYPEVPAADGACTDPGVPDVHPDRCAGPARILPLLNDAFAGGSAGADPLVNAARIEAALLWFLYLSPYKESYTCTTTPADCDSAWAYYTGGEDRAGGMGLAAYVAALDAETHDRIWDGLLAVRCWKNLDHETGTSTDATMRDAAREQLDRAALRGVALPWPTTEARS